MATYSNYYLKINKLIDTVNNIEDIAGEMLVKNVKAEAKKRLKAGNGEYPYNYSASFQRDDVTFYDKDNTTVWVKHDAANRLEYGQDVDLTIHAKEKKVMHFTGKNGEDVYVPKVEVPKGSFKPVYYARAAIKDTQKELKNKFKDIVTETNA